MKEELKKHFGYDEFRPWQAEVIAEVLKGSDTFVLMPTGGGKSLCFQLPALKLAGLTLVVSPLIALMKDQVDALRANGIAAEFINSSLNAGRIDQIMDRARTGELKILYVAPERFAAGSFREFLKSIEVSLLAVDEAHCISEWGHDFRPDYRSLGILKQMFPSVPLIALTATATERVRADILRHLNIPRAKPFVSSFDRENLNIRVVEKKKAFPRLVGLLQDYQEESVIIYCFSRRETEEVADSLRLNGFRAEAYHAGLEREERKAVQDRFVTDRSNIIVATIAFGMGIDKPDVRLIVHYTFPKTLEGYYQEIGRAGRDGLPSDCVMFYTYADVRKHEYFINRIEDDDLREKARAKLNSVLEFADLTGCRKKYLLKYFGEDMKADNCRSCDVCLTEREKMDASEVARKIMSAILRTGSRFGRNYIIDVLLGRNTQKIKTNRHDELSVHGLVDDMDEDELGQIIKQLTDNNFLLKAGGQYPTLSLSKKGAVFLQSQEKLELVKPRVNAKLDRSEGKAELDYDRGMFSILRALRKRIADEAGVPPFVVFGDTSLREMAHYFPRSKEGFGLISGVGRAKLEKYGDEFLQAIADYVEENNIEPPDRPEADIMPVKVRGKKYYSQTKELLAKKIPLKKIAKRQNLRPGTIVNHIEKLVDDGEAPDLKHLKLPQDRFEEIKQAFTVCGDEFLKPVYEHLKGKYSYDEIRLVRVLLRE